MKTNSNTDKTQIEQDALQLVMEEFSQEQKINNQHIVTLISEVKNVKDKIDSFKKESEGEIKLSQPFDISTVEVILQKGILDMKYMIGRQPKSIVRKFQVLLFPEQDAKLFYKIVFGRWILYLTVMLAITNLCKWGLNSSNNRKEVELRMIQDETVWGAWIYMYNNSDKKIKQQMDKAYINAVRAQRKSGQ
ncbi:hypothetical protein HNP37_001225 [Flavobacterium nitrogenifigens]|uniref:Uncharacterized protein n=2 Tax=Flavobacterium TaxID=237 RepID=A0A7W7IV86_9FLAO|nr:MULTISPECIES: hypothetical protein [Flavobacterium]MBB4801186.1 hypothetical protein [Flavobacterium nitrogenifigens]MBB6385066.1 hypothetical protein [Flavobacterium notoginsengisoli]